MARAPGTQGQNTTDIYFIDTEGGQATLIVSPMNGILGTKETLLLDAGQSEPAGSGRRAHRCGDEGRGRRVGSTRSS